MDTNNLSSTSSSQSGLKTDTKPIPPVSTNRLSYQGISLDQGRVPPPPSTPSAANPASPPPSLPPIHHFQSSTAPASPSLKLNLEPDSSPKAVSPNSGLMPDPAPVSPPPSPPPKPPVTTPPNPSPLPPPPGTSPKKSPQKGLVFAGLAILLLLVGTSAVFYLSSRLSNFQPVKQTVSTPTPTIVETAPEQAAIIPETFNYQCNDGTASVDWAVRIAAETYDATTGTYSNTYELTRTQTNEQFQGTVGAYLCHCSETSANGECTNCQPVTKGIVLAPGEATTSVTFSAGDVTGEDCVNCKPELSPVTGNCGSFQIDLTGLYMNSPTLNKGVKCTTDKTTTLFAICSSAVNPNDGIPECHQIPAICGGPNAVVCQGGSVSPTEDIQVGTEVTYTLDPSDYTEGWEPGIRYSYGEEPAYGEDNTEFCSTSTGTCTQPVQEPKLHFFTNLKSTIAGQPYWCRPENGGTWTTLDANGNAVDSPPPDGSTCTNTCTYSVAPGTPVATHTPTPTPTPVPPGPFCQSLNLSDTESTPVVVLVNQDGQPIADQPKIGQAVTAICEASDLPAGAAAQYQFTLIPSGQNPIDLTQTQNCDSSSPSCDFTVTNSGSFRLSCQVTSQAATP